MNERDCAHVICEDEESCLYSRQDRFQWQPGDRTLLSEPDADED